MDPVIGGALIGGAANLISNVFGSSSTRNTNKTNLKIAQMNNEWSEKMLDKQNQYNLAQWQREADYNTEMWNKTNEYNSAVNQSARFREAGLNPALMMGSGNSGVASSSSAPSGNSVGLPSPSGATMQSFTPDFSGISSSIQGALMMASQLSKNSAEVDLLKAQRDTMLAESKAKIAEMFESTRGKKYDTDYRELTESLNVTNLNEEYLGRVNSRLLQDQQMLLMRQTEILNDIQITNLPQQMRADISLKLAQAEGISMTDLAKDLKFFEKKYNIRISKEDLRMIYEAYKKKHIFAPYKSDAATIGGVIGDKIKRLWKD